MYLRWGVEIYWEVCVNRSYITIKFALKTFSKGAWGGGVESVIKKQEFLSLYYQ